MDADSEQNDVWKLRNQIQKFWNHRAQDARLFCIVLNTSNFLSLAGHIHSVRNDVEQIWDPLNIKLDSFLLMLSCLCYILIAISYFKPKYMASITWCNAVYISLRQTIWQIVTAFGKGDKKNIDVDFHLLVTTQSYAILFSAIFLFNSFEPTFQRNCVNYLTCLITGTFVILGLYEHDTFMGYFMKIAIGYLCTIYIMRIM